MHKTPAPEIKLSARLRLVTLAPRPLGRLAAKPEKERERRLGAGSCPLVHWNQPLEAGAQVNTARGSLADAVTPSESDGQQVGGQQTSVKLPLPESKQGVKFGWQDETESSRGNRFNFYQKAAAGGGGGLLGSVRAQMGACLPGLFFLVATANILMSCHL